MDIRELGRLDLNLLVALEALLEERNVTRAAERLFITQSAMSKTLGRLRELFDDPLFVRKGAGMIPTPRAEQLGRHLPQVLQAVQLMVQPQHFDPLTYEGQFNLLLQGHTGVWALPRLMKRLAVTAPGIRLRAISHSDKLFERMGSGDLDFVMHAEHRDYPAEIRLTTLGFAPPMLLAREGHPLQGKEVSWEEVAHYPQVSLLLSEIAEIQFIGDVKSVVGAGEGEYRPHLETDNLFTAIQLVLHSDYLFPAPPLFLEQNELAGELVALDVVQAEQVILKYVLARHERVLNSPPHEFIYQEILATTEEFRRSYNLPPLAEMRELHNLQY